MIMFTVHDLCRSYLRLIAISLMNRWQQITNYLSVDRRRIRLEKPDHVPQDRNPQAY